MLNSKTRHVYTVSEITQDIKLTLEDTFGQVWIEGEVSNFRAHTSGHFYFSLKDETAILAAAMFSWANKGVKFKIEDGLKVICFGRIEIYGARSQYQIIVENIEPKGVGSLQLALEQLKQKLEKEGLFKTERKKPMPYLPAKIGVVTSLQGAALKDILKVLDRRFCDLRIVISPTQVQGENAKGQIACAIKDLNSLNDQLPSEEQVEVMIVGRGGGSIEDLWAFNEEEVARAIYASKIPIISAVGHERDWTIADLVADLRAPTPSVAAELIIPKKEDLKKGLDKLTIELKRSFLETTLNFHEIIEDCRRRLSLSMQNLLRLSTHELEATQKKLALLNPSFLIEQHKIRISDLARQINVRLQHFMALRQAEFMGLAEQLSTLSPLNILGRGYSITFKMPGNTIIKDATLIKPQDTIKTRLHEGEVLSQVTEVNKNG